jgi:regulator of protease activity HflC (stomatin/prohibitin superfamily)
MKFIIPIIVIVGLITVIKNIVVVPQAKAYVVERLGTFSAVWHTGLHIKLPFIERIANKVSLKEQVIDFAPQPVITKDNVTMQIDSVVYMMYSDPKLLTYGVENHMSAVENLTATTLRNIIGDMELDETLTSRDIINSKMRSILDEATDPWGIKITRVELKNIMPPRDIQESMEKQMRAERERREKILQAEGEKKSAILLAEGEKESTILRAEAKKAAAILEAEAVRESTIKKAEGEGTGRTRNSFCPIVCTFPSTSADTKIVILSLAVGLQMYWFPDFVIVAPLAETRSWLSAIPGTEISILLS